MKINLKVQLINSAINNIKKFLVNQMSLEEQFLYIIFKVILLGEIFLIGEISIKKCCLFKGRGKFYCYLFPDLFVITQKRLGKNYKGNANRNRQGKHRELA
jgi:hypothetical protein